MLSHLNTGGRTENYVCQQVRKNRAHSLNRFALVCPRDCDF
jgi:hypothetical protein